MDQELTRRLDRMEQKIDRNCELIAELRGTSLAHTLIRWVIFPLVSILSAAYGVKLFIPIGG